MTRWSLVGRYGLDHLGSIFLTQIRHVHIFLRKTGRGMSRPQESYRAVCLGSFSTTSRKLNCRVDLQSVYSRDGSQICNGYPRG